MRQEMLYIFKLNSKRSWSSRLASLRRNSIRLSVAALFAALTTVAWHQCHRYGAHLPKGAEEMLGDAILVLAAIFAIAGAMILAGVWEHLREISRCVLMHDEEKFMLIRDERMPIAMHLVLAVSGLLVLVLLGAAEYPSSAHGAIIMFSTSFAMMLYFIVIGDLQHATNSVWFKTRIPKEWDENNVDEYFRSVTKERRDQAAARIASS
jgi:hypothetical protein